MTMSFDGESPHLVLGYDLDKWNGYGVKAPISIDLSPKNNSHILISGMSGSGKSYMEQAVFAKLAVSEPDGAIFFADYKGDDFFKYLRDCPRYFCYKDALQALDAVHTIMTARQSGKDTGRQPVTLMWDEYMAQALSLISEDKRAASVVMGKVSEILLLGRSLAVRLLVSCQRPDSLAFPAGSRLNYGVVVILGAAVKSIYEMLLPDFREDVQGRQFGQGEGIVLLQGSELRFIKVPMVRDIGRMQELCIKALDPRRPPCEA